MKAKGKGADAKLSSANVNFCNLVANGDKPIVKCLVEAYPKYAKKGAAAVKMQAHRLVTRPEIVAEIARIKEKTEAKIEDKYAGLKDEMIDRLVKGIRAGTDGEPMTVVEFTKCIDILAKMGGWYAPTDVNLRNGGYTADYKGPPTLMTMTDEELSAKLTELREGR